MIKKDNARAKRFHLCRNFSAFYRLQKNFKHMKYLCLLTFCLLSLSCLAQKSYSLLWDDYYSPMAAGESLLTANRVASDALWKVLPAKLTDESTRKQRNLGRIYRAAKFLFLEATLFH